MTLQTNLISAELSDDDLNSSVESIKQVESKVGFALTLKKEDAATLAKVGPKILEFTEKAYEYAVKNPNLKPDFVDLAEFQKDYLLSKKLQILRNHLVPLTEKLVDTYTAAASEAYMAARLFYHHLKNAARANVPGASAMVDEMAKLYERTSSSRAKKKNNSTSTDSNLPNTDTNKK